MPKASTSHRRCLGASNPALCPRGGLEPGAGSEGWGINTPNSPSLTALPGWSVSSLLPFLQPSQPSKMMASTRVNF